MSKWGELRKDFPLFGTDGEFDAAGKGGISTKEFEVQEEFRVTFRNLDEAVELEAEYLAKVDRGDAK